MELETASPDSINKLCSGLINTYHFLGDNIYQSRRGQSNVEKAVFVGV